MFDIVYPGKFHNSWRTAFSLRRLGIPFSVHTHPDYRTTIAVGWWARAALISLRRRTR